MKKAFIDASFYLALLNAKDHNHQKARKIAKKFLKHRFITSQLVIGEVLTVGSMRINKPLTITFAEKILESSTLIVLESQELNQQAFSYFKQIASKNISWVDCVSFAIINQLKIGEALTFDKDFEKYRQVYAD